MSGSERNQEKFVADLRTIDPNATGAPVQLYEYESLLKNSYITAAWYALAAIASWCIIHFRSITAVILALLARRHRQLSGWPDAWVASTSRSTSPTS
jgi:predicted RND superfamily exporter protein